MAERIALSDFTLRYSGTSDPVLSSLSFELERGSCCAILGPSGAGKSTLLQALAGSLGKHHPESLATGTLAIGSRSFQGVPRDILFPSVGLVLQDPYVQISGIRDTVFEELLFTLENIGAATTQAETAVWDLLRRLGIEHLSQRKPTTLSGGETQRVALAGILIAQPAVLLLDEPTTALDPHAQGQFRDILKSLRGRATIVLTDTQPDFALGLCDRVLVLDNGVIVFDGSPRRLLSDVRRFRSLLVLERWGWIEELLSTSETAMDNETARVLRFLDTP